jgi:hypothetical protein
VSGDGRRKQMASVWAIMLKQAQVNYKNCVPMKKKKKKKRR